MAAWISAPASWRGLALNGVVTHVRVGELTTSREHCSPGLSGADSVDCLLEARRCEIEEAAHFQWHLPTRYMNKMNGGGLRLIRLKKDLQLTTFDRFSRLVMQQTDDADLMDCCLRRRFRSRDGQARLDGNVNRSA